MKSFDSFTEFALHVGELQLAAHEMEHAALEKAAVLVETRAKEKIGEYQDEAAPFVGWAELADSTKDDRVRQGYPEDEPGLRSGGMRDSIEHVVIDREAHVGSNDDKLVYFELGTIHQPPRSVLGGAVVEKMDEVLQIVGKTAVAALVGEGVHNGKMLIEND